MKKSTISFLVFGIIIAVSVTFVWQWWQQQQTALAIDIAVGNGRIEADQPDIIQPFTWLLPSRHYMEFSQAVVFRDAELDLVWPQLTIITALGAAFFIASLAMFRRSLERMT